MKLSTPRWWYVRDSNHARMTRTALKPLGWVWAAVTVASIQKPVGVGMPAAASCAGVPTVIPRNWKAVGVMLRSTLRSANRFSEVPACSNRVKKTTEPKIRTTASIIRSRWARVWQTLRMT